jgi:hypothetical protein
MSNIVTLKIKINDATDSLDAIYREVDVDTSKMHASWLARVVEYGTRRLLNDTFSADKGQTKFDLVKGLAQDMQSGEAMVEKVRKAGVASKADPARKMAREAASSFLTSRFVKAFGKDSAKWIEQAKIAHLFTLTEKGNVKFDLAALDVWMEDFAPTQDFVQEARDMLAGSADLGLDDLGF